MLWRLCRATSEGSDSMMGAVRTAPSRRPRSVSRSAEAGLGSPCGGVLRAQAAGKHLVRLGDLFARGFVLTALYQQRTECFEHGGAVRMIAQLGRLCDV